MMSQLTVQSAEYRFTTKETSLRYIEAEPVYSRSKILDVCLL